MTDTFAENAKDALDIRLDEKGGFDELVAKDARYVHVEVLDRTAVYIGVQTADGRVAKLTVCANRLSYYYEVSGKQIAENANCSGWLPIESAPKDETSVDLWVVGNGRCWRIPDAWWCPHDEAWMTFEADYGSPGPCLGPNDKATHWMWRPGGPEGV